MNITSTILRITLSLSLLLAFTQVHSQQISFPGAEGAGRFASGGRGTAKALTTVFEVTNLTDKNTVGSLRYACSQSISKVPYRTIVFRVSGTIHLNSKLPIPENTTVAGQTAPGDGICIADYPVVISGDNVIVRYMRFRMGDKNQLKTNHANCGVPVAPFKDTSCIPLNGSGGDDAFGGLSHSNIIIDHCTVGWGVDESLTVYRGDSLTLQWNLISEGLNYSYHFETGDTDFEHHGYGGIWGGLHATFHHNLFAHFKSRNPRFSGNSTYPAGSFESADFRNNVIYNWGLFSAYGGEGGHYNMVNNYYKSGPSTGSGTRYRIVNVDSSVAEGYAHYYLSGNYMYGSAKITNSNWLGAYMNTGKSSDSGLSKVATPFIPDWIPSYTNTAQEAYDTVIKYAGVTIPRRDTLDQRVINDVENRIGRLIDVQGDYPHATPYAQTVNAWPTLNSETAPVDSDHDGMPDSWETANGLNPNNAADRGIFAANGYTNLENYLNGITTSPTPITTNIATATWPLLVDQSPTVKGNISATNQVVGSGLADISYGKTFGTINGWQTVGTTSFLPKSYTANAYLQYNVTPLPGKIFTVNAIGLSALGGGGTGVKTAVYYSLDSFATANPIAGGCFYNGATSTALSTSPISLLSANTASLAGEQASSSPTSITVLPNQTLSLRVYVWNTSTANRYFANQNVTINGITSDAPLSVNLTDLFAEVINERVRLNWNTVNETNMKGYEIERSVDGHAFVFIGNIAAKNLTNNNYQFTDDNKLENTVYYRLKTIEKDGKYAYSKIVKVVTGRNQMTAKLFPNPVNSQLTVSLNTFSGNRNAEILSIVGKKLMQFTIENGSVSKTIDVSKLAKGQYLLVIKGGLQSESTTLKFTKE